MNVLCAPVLVLAAVLLVAGCRQERATAIRAEAWERYPVRGVVQRIEPGGKQAVIEHEEIPGYMAAMTMEFTAVEARELAGVQPGDEVTFQLNVGAAESFIDAVKKTGKRGAITVSSGGTAAGLVPGMEWPDVELLDEKGRAFRIADLRGKAVAVTFIFTRCPLPDFCPRMNARFQETRGLLGEMAVSGKTAFVSITIDPEHDTPERLAAYAAGLGVDTDGWVFASGERDAIHRLATAAGVTIEGAGPSLNHNLRTFVLDREGRVSRVFPGNAWTARELAIEMRRVAGK